MAPLEVFTGSLGCTLIEKVLEGGKRGRDKIWFLRGEDPLGPQLGMNRSRPRGALGALLLGLRRSPGEPNHVGGVEVKHLDLEGDSGEELASCVGLAAPVR